MFNSLIRFIRWHLTCLYDYLDPIAQSGEGRLSGSPSQDLAFLFPLLQVFLTTFIGNVLLPLTQGGVHLTWTSLSSSSGLIFRQMYPRTLWAQTDVIVTIAIFAILAIYASFLLHPWTISRYTLNSSNVLLSGIGTIDRTTAGQILQYHRRLKGPAFLSLAVLVAFGIAFTTGNILINGAYGPSLYLALFCLLLLPLFILYLVFSLFGIAIFIILTSSFIGYRQKAVLAKLEKVTGNVAQNWVKLPQKSRLHLWKVTFLKLQHKLLNGQVLAICRDIQAYANFWSPSLTFFFLNHITLMTYCLYIVFLVDNLLIWQKFTFLYYLIEVGISLFCLIHICARIVKFNRAIETVNRRFYFHLLKSGAFSRFNLSYQLYVQLLPNQRRLRQYAFRLFDNYRITSQTFYMVLSNISLFFFLVFKNDRISA